MSKKAVEVRCPENLVKKDGESRCNRFLAQISDHEIRIPCTKCGALHSIIRDQASGKIRMQTIPKATAIISEKEKQKNVE